MPFHELIGKFASTLQLTHKFPSRRSPHRLTDNLHWQCPACQSRVTTRDTQFHLIGCLLSMVEPMSRFNPSSRISAFMNSIDIKGSILIDPEDRRAHTKIRPQTRVVRPTPNICHPVISIDDCKEAKDCTRAKAPDPQNSRKDNLLPSNAKTKNTHKAIQLPSPSSTTAVEVTSRISLGNERASQRINQKRKYKSTIEQEESVKVSGDQSDGLKEEIHAMSRLMVKGRKKQSPSSDKITKVQRGRYSGCDPAGWDHFKSKLTSCSKCKRSFFPYRVAAHEKVCTEYRSVPSQVPPTQRIRVAKSQ